MFEHHVVLSGCSGGGKSTLLAELAQRGWPTVAEPGRRIVTTEQQGGGAALPWVDLAAFARRALALAWQDRQACATSSGWVFFDRGLIDAAVALVHATGQPLAEVLAPYPRYYDVVFLTPPWPEIYVVDAERPHGLAEAVAEYERLCAAYAALGYTTVEVPQLPVAQRADFVLAQVGELPRPR